MCAGAVAISSFGVSAQQLPEGAGKEILEKQCTTCHKLEIIVDKRNDAKEWRRLVMEMLDRGAEITEEQVPVVVDYLTANYGKAGEPEKPAAQSAPMAPVAAH
jgi:hypothetical protein